MTKPATITRWLQEPSSLILDDIIEAEELIKTHPYFVPARYVSAIVPHSKQAFDANMMSQMQLYKGHWLYLNDFLTNASIEGQGQNNVASQNNTPHYADDNSFGDLNDFNEEPEEDDDLDSYDDEGSNIDDFIAKQEEKPNTQEEENTVTTITPDVVIEAKETIITTQEQPNVEAVIETKEVYITPQEQPNEEVVVLPNNTAEKEITITPTLVGTDAVLPILEAVETNTTPAAAPPVLEEAQIPEVPTATAHLAIDPAAPAIEEVVSTTQPIRVAGKEPSLIQPIYTEDYFLHLGIQLPEKQKDTASPQKETPKQDKDKSLMVVMSFSEWLIHFKTKGEREKEEVEDQRALKTMWQKEKLAAALEEENEEIPENVFEMAVNSIAKEDDLASESLAEIMLKQGKYDKAIEMYRKLSLRNPQKNVYFARKIEDINKEKLL